MGLRPSGLHSYTSRTLLRALLRDAAVVGAREVALEHALELVPRVGALDDRWDGPDVVGAVVLRIQSVNAVLSSPLSTRGVWSWKVTKECSF